MNRHERRKQKKTGMTANASSNELNQAIQLHTKKSFDEAESLYKKIIALGGISNENLKKLKLAKCEGFAGISYFQKKTASLRGRLNY